MKGIVETDLVKDLRSFGITPENGFVIVGCCNQYVGLGPVDVFVDGVRISKGLEQITLHKSVKRGTDHRLSLSGELRFNEDGTLKFENEDADEKLLYVLSRYFGYKLIKGEALEADR